MRLHGCGENVRSSRSLNLRKALRMAVVQKTVLPFLLLGLMITRWQWKRRSASSSALHTSVEAPSEDNQQPSVDSLDGLKAISTSRKVDVSMLKRSLVAHWISRTILERPVSDKGGNIGVMTRVKEDKNSSWLTNCSRRPMRLAICRKRTRISHPC